MNRALIAIVIVGIIYWLYRALSKPAAKDNKTAGKTNTENTQNNKFRSVEIIPGQECCQTALNLRGKMFLMEEAPRLPLPACSNPEQCKCRFARYQDRRHGKRRANVFASKQVKTGNTPKSDNRKSRGRRKSDQQPPPFAE